MSGNGGSVLPNRSYGTEIQDGSGELDEGRCPGPAQFYMLATEERWDSGGERPYLPFRPALSVPRVHAW